jgi:hypothetical protein
MSSGLAGAGSVIAGFVLGSGVGLVLAIVSLVRGERPGWVSGISLLGNLLVVGLVAVAFLAW